MDQIFQDLNVVSKKHSGPSVHLTDFPKYNKRYINNALERRMNLAQNITSLALSLRKKEKIRVRQPLQKIMIPIHDSKTQKDVESVASIIKGELNIKEVMFLNKDSSVLRKKIKPNFKTLGPKYGGEMKFIVDKIANFTEIDIAKIEKEKSYQINKNICLEIVDVEISSEDIPGFSVASNNEVTVALDVTITKQLKEEGIAREFVNRIQTLRKDKGLTITDKISIWVQKNDLITTAIKNNFAYICEETLAEKLNYSENAISNAIKVDLIDGISINVSLLKN